MALVLALVALALVLGACGGGDDEDATTTSPAPATTTPSPSDGPSQGPTSPGAGQLPPELVECFADKGVEVESPAEIHSAPPEVVQECFSALHGGGGP
jgi:hypothetical protein